MMSVSFNSTPTAQQKLNKQQLGFGIRFNIGKTLSKDIQKLIFEDLKNQPEVQAKYQDFYTGLVGAIEHHNANPAMHREALSDGLATIDQIEVNYLKQKGNINYLQLSALDNKTDEYVAHYEEVGLGNNSSSLMKLFALKFLTDLHSQLLFKRAFGHSPENVVRNENPSSKNLQERIKALTVIG